MDWSDIFSCDCFPLYYKFFRINLVCSYAIDFLGAYDHFFSPPLLRVHNSHTDDNLAKQNSVKASVVPISKAIVKGKPINFTKINQ